MDGPDARKLHEAVGMVGLRAQATAVGLVQLSIELCRAGVISPEALGRVKEAILADIMLSRPVSVSRDEYERSIRRRIDGLFAGVEPMGPKPFEVPK